VKRKVFTIFFFSLFTCQLFGSGFQINEHGARPMGLAGAFTGLANDPSAVYFNSAGLVQLKGTQFSIGGTFISPSSTFTGPSPATTESKLKARYFTPLNAYFTHQLSNDLWVGVGFNNPFGLGTEWEEDWVGRYRTTKTEIRTFNFSPVIAYKISDQLSASVGFTYSYSDVIIQRKLQVLVPTQQGPVAFPDADVKLEGDGSSFGYSAAIFFKASDALSLGASFHGPISYDYEGTATTDAHSSTPAPVVGLMPSGGIKAPLTTPFVGTIGAAYHASECLLFAADFQYNGWSSYDKLEVTFDTWADPRTGSKVSTSEREFENSFIFRLGSEYKVSQPLTLRGGVLYDKNPVKDERLDPTLPDADRTGLNIGLSYKLIDNLSLDLAYLYLMFTERTITTSKEFIPLGTSLTPINGTYKSSAHLIGMNLSYTF